MKKENRKYSIKKQFYLDDSLNSQLLSDLKLSNKNMGDYLRELINDDKNYRKSLIVKNENKETVQNFLEEVRKQGNNLNQIAYNLNSQQALKKYNHSEIQEIRDNLIKIYKEIKKKL